jgi:hypothetical protein
VRRIRDFRESLTRAGADAGFGRFDLAGRFLSGMSVTGVWSDTAIVRLFGATAGVDVRPAGPLGVDQPGQTLVAVPAAPHRPLA